MCVVYDGLQVNSMWSVDPGSPGKMAVTPGVCVCVVYHGVQVTPGVCVCVVYHGVQVIPGVCVCVVYHGLQVNSMWSVERWPLHLVYVCVLFTMVCR